MYVFKCVCSLGECMGCLGVAVSMLIRVAMCTCVNLRIHR